MPAHSPRPRRAGSLGVGLLVAAALIATGAAFAAMGFGFVREADLGFADNDLTSMGLAYGPALDVPRWVGGVVGLALALAGGVLGWGSCHEWLAQAPQRNSVSSSAARARSVAQLGLALFVGTLFSLAGAVMALAGLGVIQTRGGGSAESLLMAAVGAAVVLFAGVVTLSSVYRWWAAPSR